MSDELVPFSTSDTPFAAYLRYHSHEVVGVQKDKNDKRRMVFIFVKEERTQALEDEYYNHVAQVEPEAFYRALKDMYRRLNGSR